MNISIGDKFERKRKVTDDLIRHFADLSGDLNPIHLDEEFAANTRFGKRIAHGMLSGAFISAVIGDEFRERKIVYLSQFMKFVSPVYIGDEITAIATVTGIRHEKQIVTLDTTCVNHMGQNVVTGEAMIMILN